MRILRWTQNALTGQKGKDKNIPLLYITKVKDSATASFKPGKDIAVEISEDDDKDKEDNDSEAGKDGKTEFLMGGVLKPVVEPQETPSRENRAESRGKSSQFLQQPGQAVEPDKSSQFFQQPGQYGPYQRYDRGYMPTYDNPNTTYYLDPRELERKPGRYVNSKDVNTSQTLYTLKTQSFLPRDLEFQAYVASQEKRGPYAAAPADQPLPTRERAQPQIIYRPHTAAPAEQPLRMGEQVTYLQPEKVTQSTKMEDSLWEMTRELEIR